jgi:protein SCO1/2
MTAHAARQHTGEPARLSRRWAVIAIVAIILVELAIGAGMYINRKFTVPDLDLPGVTVYSDPVDLPAFSLVDHEGRVFDNARLRGHWTFMTFGYTSCPDFCPMTLAEMARVFQGIDQIPGGARDARFVFISVDPYRDSRDVLAQYVRHFRPDFLGVTGEPAQLNDLVNGAGLYYEYTEAAAETPLRDVLTRPERDDYVVVHYSGVMLIDPEGKLLATVLPPFDVERMLQIYATLRN